MWRGWCSGRRCSAPTPPTRSWLRREAKQSGTAAPIYLSPADRVLCARRDSRAPGDFARFNPRYAACMRWPFFQFFARRNPPPNNELESLKRFFDDEELQNSRVPEPQREKIIGGSSVDEIQNS